MPSSLDTVSMLILLSFDVCVYPNDDRLALNHRSSLFVAVTTRDRKCLTGRTQGRFGDRNLDNQHTLLNLHFHFGTPLVCLVRALIVSACHTICL